MTKLWGNARQFAVITVSVYYEPSNQISMKPPGSLKFLYDSYYAITSFTKLTYFMPLSDFIS